MYAAHCHYLRLSHVEGNTWHGIPAREYSIGILTKFAQRDLAKLLSYHTGNDQTSVQFDPPPETPTATAAPPSPPIPPPEPPQQKLPGFNHPRENWTKAPDFLFTHVMPNSTPTAFKLVACVIHNTLGKRDKLGNFSEWWAGVSYKLIMEKTGTTSRTAVSDAITEARRNGWIKRRGRANSFDYALRWDDEPPDTPEI
ncbi:MAG: hypothetical protein IPK82_23585 [Polyangiaceae bacterium]|nr:hypothetical protein [Polyangiaceae bacterium]